ncbi:MAG: YeeE/YedE family protein [Gammaproteobacteria bacterium]
MEPGTIPSALLGGAIIGVAAVMMLALNGRIMGVSGIAAGLLSQQTSDKALRLLFLVGMVVGGLIVARLLPAAMPGAVTTNIGWLMAAGFIVGFGTRLGGGCTSGHGVCGMSRLSARSIVATCVFMSIAMVSVFIIRHVVGAAV